MREIDELLALAIAMNSGDGLFYWFRALLRDDYYRMNGLTCPEPSVMHIIEAAVEARTDLNQLRVLLSDLAMAGNSLHSQLFNMLE